MKIAMLCAVTLGALGLHTAAYAQSPEADAAAEASAAAEVSTAIAVRYGDLDLSRSGDVHTLYHRLQTAALEACGASTFSVAPYRDAVERSACYRQGLAQAVQAVNLPAVNALAAPRAAELASN
jgi:UrcA family protein